MSHWVLLYVAIMLEVAGTTCMKLSNGFKVLVPSIATLLFYWASLAALSYATKHVPISTAYAIWAGLGTTLTALLGTLYFNDPLSTAKIVSLGLVIVGVVGLNLSGGHAH